MMMIMMLVALVFPGVRGLSPSIERRAVLAGTATAGLVAALPSLAADAPPAPEVAVVTTRMGGLLEKFADINRGFRMMKPSTWNQFDGEAGAYDLRWADIVEASSSITVSSSSYSGGSIDTLADVDTLAAKLQKSRGDIVSKSRRVSEGVLFYDYEFGNPNSMHELLSLCVNKSRLWQISAKSPEKSWSKREDLYRNVVSVFRIHQRHPLHRRLMKSSQRADQDSSLYFAI